MIPRAWRATDLARPEQFLDPVVLKSGSSEPEANRILVPPENPERLGHFHLGPDGPANAKNERSFSLVSRSRDESVRTNAQRSA